MHPQAEQVLDPVVGVGPAAPWPHLDEPRPDVGGRSPDRHHARRDDVGLREEVVARERPLDLFGSRAPVQVPVAEAAAVREAARGCRQPEGELFSHCGPAYAVRGERRFGYGPRRGVTMPR
ncbi:MAG TPA: hypothetical protein VNB65_05080 [Gaiellaceae bacterium]|nr:hypothetical protein [Gaiellaceae bacterium]